ncbi:MAG: class I SAM-dependent methyltransferase [Gammaproteobacteria bacterium]
MKSSACEPIYPESRTTAPSCPEVRERLRNLFKSSYSSERLSGIDPQSFHAAIKQYIAAEDSAGEGYLDRSKQRDLSIKYHWGHNHDFGDGVAYPGRMGDRHIDIVARFIADYGLPIDLHGKRVLDIGVWTGGTSLLLVAMGAEVVALEEVVKYAETVNFLAGAFGLSERLKCLPKSLYDALPMFADDFDYILYSGVIYHVTDPVLSLRVVFSALRNGGSVFLETFGFNSPDCVCRYEGPSIFYGGKKEDMSRGGWNYFVPSPTCLAAWCKDAGFQKVQISQVNNQSRIMGSATRTQFEDFCRAGVSFAMTR